MCGIAGIYNFREGQPVEQGYIQRMVATMKHRGPDDEGFYINGPVGIGMARLSIIDVEGGHQPIHNEDGAIWVVFNGEIYNFPELKQKLLSKGHTFYTRSDTEVIVHAYEEWEDDCLLRFNGIFGIAIWDGKSQRLLLARDPFGVKPLYYLADSQRLIFASEAKAILADREINREVDLEALDLYLTFRFVPSPHCLFKGFRKIQPGHKLVCQANGISVERYYHAKPRIESALTEDDYINLLAERLEQAVSRQMISDVPVGALLSGGIDSAAVVAIMTKYTDLPVKTFTIGFRGDYDANELKEARSTARLFGTEHHEVILDSPDFQQWLKTAIWYLDEPNCSTSALPMYFVSKLAHDHVKVVLSGQGADEPHCGYHRYIGERYSAAYRNIPGPLRHYVLGPLVEALPRQERLKRAVRSLGIRRPSERFVRVYEVFSDNMKKDLWYDGYRHQVPNNLAERIVEYWRQGTECMDSLGQMAYVDARLSLSDDLLLYGDKMSMATSVEARVPFLDLDYMEAAEALPARFRIRGFTRKYIHKKVVKKWLPEEVIQRKKKGFETPMNGWLRSELSGYVRETLLSPSSGCLAFFRKEAIDRMVTDHMRGRFDYQRQLYALLVFEIWHEQFIRRG